MYSIYVQVLLEAGCVTVYCICSGSAGGWLFIVYVQVLLKAGCV